jgi:hypothetical protein
MAARKSAGLAGAVTPNETRKSALGRRSSSRTPKQTQAQPTTRDYLRRAPKAAAS